jgi:hypothetical protein
MEREVLQMCLEYIETNAHERKHVRHAIQAALAQPAQEPVAWLEPEWGEKICPEVGYEATITDDHPRDLCWIPLYTAPPQPAPWPPSSVITPEYLAEQENKNKKMRALLDDDDDTQDYRKPWRGLTDEQRLAALVAIDPLTARLPRGLKLFAEAIEKLLKDQNT